MAIAVAVAIATALLLGRRRGSPDTPDHDAAAATGAATPKPTESATAETASGDALAAELNTQSTALWASALSSTRFDYAIPAEHEPIMLASRKALAADPLSDRYFRLSAVPVESIQRAVVVCGTDGLQSLAATALVPPVFRGGSAEHSRFPAALWERCTQASIAAEACARQWCPADRQAAQLLALLSALGPRVAYRVVEDQYRAQPKLKPAPAVFLQVIDRFARVMAARIATLWQSPPRIVAALQGE